MRGRKKLLGVALAISLILAACSTEEPQAPDPPPGSTIPGSADCGLQEGDTPFVIDIDDDGAVETIFLKDSDDGAALVVCFGDIAHHEMELVGEGIEIVGFNDLDDDGTGEILFSKETEEGREVNAVTVTQRGLRLTGVQIIDTEMKPTDEPFTADSFQCIDWHDDGEVDLVHWQFMPAGDDVNVRALLVELEGLVPVEGAVDSYETSPQDAYEILNGTDGCMPGEEVLRPLRFAATGWAALALDPSIFGSSDDLVLAGTASTESTSVAVGTHAPNVVYGELIEPKPAAWWTEDGLQWGAAQVPGEDAEMLDVVAANGQYIAVGRVGADPAIWRSNDGKVWDLTTLDTNADGGQAIMYSVHHNPEIGFVVAGAEFYWPQSGGFQDSDTAIWLSGDGYEWERVQAEAFGSQGYQPNDDGEFNGAAYDVIYASGIGIVAIGHDSNSNPDIDYPDQFPSVWLSADGSEWSRSRLEADARLTGLAVANDAILAFGTTNRNGSPTADGALVISADGANWSDLVDGFGSIEDPDGIQSIHSVVQSLDGTFLAIGSDQAELDSIGAAAVWKSRDLNSWERVAHVAEVFGSLTEDPAPFILDGATTSGGMLIAVGGTGITTDLVGGSSTCCTYEPRIWLYDPSRDVTS